MTRSKFQISFLLFSWFTFVIYVTFVIYLTFVIYVKINELTTGSSPAATSSESSPAAAATTTAPASTLPCKVAWLSTLVAVTVAHCSPDVLLSTYCKLMLI